MSEPAAFKDRRILLVEDEALVAMMVEDMLRDFGATVAGPAHALAQALEFAATEALDAALLDVNLGGEPVYPVAEELARRGIPFAFASGYGESGIAEGFRDRPVLQKPFDEATLVSVLSGLIRG